MKNIKFQLEQVEHILKDMYLDSLPFNLCINDKLKLFNLFPSMLQGECIKWGCNETETREDIFEYLCDKQFDMTISEYYDSKYSNMEDIDIDFSKF